MSKLRAFASSDAIILSWDSVGPSEILRSEVGVGAWTELVASTAAGHYVDGTAVPETIYRYFVRCRAEGVELRSGDVWINATWGWNTVTQVLAPSDTMNRPTYRARILDTTGRLPLRAGFVAGVTRRVYTVLDNCVTAVPRWDPVTDPQSLDPHEVLTPTLVVDRCWLDKFGYNFSHSPELDLEGEAAGTYVTRYRLEATNGRVIDVAFYYNSIGSRRIL